MLVPLVMIETEEILTKFMPLIRVLIICFRFLEGEKTQEFLSVVASSHNPRAILNFRVLLKETFVVSLLRNS
ncbi:hypothetical protein D0Y65_004081 [Glycine soja]|uniref:Uncharacterized protein n=1 Tax=Glycine soja TaxID=3848 RepID=A0A445LQN9_GLYSO|nr:hypothetical protein D0Y65_004081 [Glycine soja]